MRKLAADIIGLAGAVAGFIGAWVAMTAWVELTGVPFGLPGIVIVCAVFVFYGTKTAKKVARRYSAC